MQRNLNLVLTSGEYGGDMAFLGAGAGGDPTAVAVVSDLMFVAESWSGGGRKKFGRDFHAKISCDFETPWYLRFFVRDQPGIVARLAQILAGASHEYRFAAAETGVREVVLAVCDYAGALPRLDAASGLGRNGGAGFLNAAVVVPAYLKY